MEKINQNSIFFFYKLFESKNLWKNFFISMKFAKPWKKLKYFFVYRCCLEWNNANKICKTNQIILFASISNAIFRRKIQISSSLNSKIVLKKNYKLFKIIKIFINDPLKNKFLLKYYIKNIKKIYKLIPLMHKLNMWKGMAKRCAISTKISHHAFNSFIPSRME